MLLLALLSLRLGWCLSFTNRTNRKTLTYLFANPIINHFLVMVHLVLFLSTGKANLWKSIYSQPSLTKALCVSCGLGVNVYYFTSPGAFKYRRLYHKLERCL
jgi:hypothetical protein